MSDVKRYSMRRMGMNLLPDGDYVRHSDYAALEARLEAMTRERDAMIAPEYVQGLIDLAEPMLSDALGAAEGEIAALQARLAEVESLARGQGEQIEIQGNTIIRINDYAGDQQARAERAEAALATARRDVKDVDDFINMPWRNYTEESMEVREYRHALYPIWSKFIRALIAQEEPTT